VKFEGEAKIWRRKRAFFQRFDSFISFSINLLPSWAPAFAMTVHKSQGSEFDDVLVVLPDNDNHRLLTRKIIYTGITRAKNRLILSGNYWIQRAKEKISDIDLPVGIDFKENESPKQ